MNDFLDDFLEWKVSPEGQLSEHVWFNVVDSLEHCTVDPNERVIVWDDGLRLSIPQTVQRIHLKSQLPLKLIDTHVVGWLEVEYEPKGLNERQMEEFEILIDDWVRDYELSQNGDGLNPV